MFTLKFHKHHSHLVMGELILPLRHLCSPTQQMLKNITCGLAHMTKTGREQVPGAHVNKPSGLSEQCWEPDCLSPWLGKGGTPEVVEGGEQREEPRGQGVERVNW